MDSSGYNRTLTNTTLDDIRRSYLDVSKMLSITLYSIIFILGIIGNGLVIWIAGFRMKKTISAVWFLHLAIADFLCCLSLPLFMAERVYKSSSYVAQLDIFCVSIIFLFYTNISTSVLLLTAISIDRWVLVMRPLWAKTRRTYRLVRMSAGIIWVLSFLSSGLICYSNRWCLRPRTESDFRDIRNIKKITRPLLLVVMFLVPFLIIFTSYATVFFKLRKGKRTRRSQKPYRIITAVILCFFICYFPYHIWPLIPIYDVDSLQFHTLNTIINTLACFNSCLNPILYVFMGQEFRHGFLRSLSLKLERAFGEPTTDSCRENSEHISTREHPNVYQ